MRPLLAAFVLFALSLSCADDPVVEVVSPPPVLHRPDVLGLDGEAEEAALWLSGELTAPGPLYEAIHDDLAAIRSEYPMVAGDYAPRFTPWWLPSVVGILVTTELKNKILAHAPNPLDSLNTGLHGVSDGRFSGPYGSLGWQGSIRFAGRLHPQRLTEFYKTVPGVNNAFVDGPIGDYSNVYPRQIPGGMSYLFRFGFGDCPAGCEVSDFYYFRRVGEVTEFVGSFRTYFDPYPAWWPEASTAYCTFEMEHWGWPYCPWASTTAPSSPARTVMTSASAAP
jgi:hypothetical protein